MTRNLTVEEGGGVSDLVSRFEREWRESEPSLRCYARKMTKGRIEDAEDLLQIACLRAYRSFDKFHGGSKFKTWLYTIIRNVHLDLQKKRRIFATSYDVSLDCIEGDAALVNAIEDPSDLQEEFFKQEEASQVRQLLRGSCSTDIDALMLECVFDDLKYREIARRLNIPEGTVKSRVSRMCRNLASHPALEVA